MHLIMQCQLQSSKGSCLWLSSLPPLLLGVQRRRGRAGRRQKEGMKPLIGRLVFSKSGSDMRGESLVFAVNWNGCRAFCEESPCASVFSRILKPSLGAKQVRDDETQADSTPHLSFLVCRTSFIVSEEKCPLLAPRRPHSRPGEIESGELGSSRGPESSRIGQADSQVFRWPRSWRLRLSFGKSFSQLALFSQRSQSSENFMSLEIKSFSLRWCLWALRVLGKDKARQLHSDGCSFHSPLLPTHNGPCHSFHRPFHVLPEALGPEVRGARSNIRWGCHFWATWPLAEKPDSGVVRMLPDGCPTFPVWSSCKCSEAVLCP